MHRKSDQYRETLSSWQKQRARYLELMEQKQRQREQQMNQSAREDVANQGWWDQMNQGAATGAAGGSAFGPWGTAVGGIIGALTGGGKAFVESGMAGEKAGIKDPWANALVPIRTDPATGVMSGGPGTATAQAGIVDIMGKTDWASMGEDSPSSDSYDSRIGQDITPDAQRPSRERPPLASTPLPITSSLDDYLFQKHKLRGIGLK